ncbi:MAG: SET domain-containing protein [Planctomycetia bacterium]|nr:SET domain-containing protein [Planctomycetia bacterium]
MAKARTRRNKDARPEAWAKRVRVARARTGRGVFSERWFAVAEIVGEIEGAIIDDLEYSSRYCMDLGDSRCLEPDPPFRYMNHSCQPNCRFQWHDIQEAGRGPPRRRMFVLALERIAPDVELTIDYRWPAHMAIPCRCGTDACRAWIVAEDDLAAVLAAIGGRERAATTPSGSGASNAPVCQPG